MAKTFATSIPIGYLIHEVARLLKRRFEDEARVHGMTLPQWRALAEVAKNPGISQVALSGCIDSDQMTTSGLVDRLEKRGLIERYPSPDDSRAKLARITPDGEVLVDLVRGVGLQIYGEAMVGVGKAEQKVLTEALGRIRDNLGQTSTQLKEEA